MRQCNMQSSQSRNMVVHVVAHYESPGFQWLARNRSISSRRFPHHSFIDFITSRRMTVAFYQRSHDRVMPDTDCYADARNTRQQGCKEHELRVTCLLRPLPNCCRVFNESKVLTFMIVTDSRVLLKEKTGLVTYALV
jgi:hypothetical protein